MVSGFRKYLLRISLALLIVMISSSAAFAATSKINNKVYTHPAFFNTSLHKLFHGVDVSYWQGAINWTKSKAAGIDFAIIRCGYTALNKFSLHQDSTFINNYVNARNAGVSIGIYYYACATTPAEARKEANYVVSIMRNNNIKNQLPVVLDYEIDSGRANRVYKSLEKSYGKAYARKRFTNNAKAFMNTLKASGYETMFYSYRVMVDPKFSNRYRFNMAQINGSNQYRFWLAQYSSSNSYSGKMELWQFSSTGRVDGMRGNIDRNFWYYPLAGVPTKDGTKSIRKAKITLKDKAFKYTGSIIQPAVTVKFKGKKLKAGTDYTVSYMNNIKKGIATALIHGKGKFSNEAYITFKIANKGSTAPKSVVLGDSAIQVKPDKVTGLKTHVKEEKKALTCKWASAANATRYQVTYRVNEGKWIKKNTKSTSYVIQDLAPGSAVEVHVRAQNVKGKKILSGGYTKIKRRYIRSLTSKCTVLDRNRAKVTWSPVTDKKGKVTYQVVRYCVYLDTTNMNTSSTSMIVSGKNRYCYDISAKPILNYNGKKYTGTDANVSNVYFIYGKITSLKPVSGGFKVTYPKTTGIGDPKYLISYSQDASLKNAKTKTRPQDKTACTVKNLGSKKTYYVAVQTFKILDGHTYYGVKSPVTKVITG